MEYAGSCYKFVNKTSEYAYSWNEARYYCQQDNADLASIGSQSENDFVVANLGPCKCTKTSRRHNIRDITVLTSSVVNYSPAERVDRTAFVGEQHVFRVDQLRRRRLHQLGSPRTKQHGKWRGLCQHLLLRQLRHTQPSPCECDVTCCCCCCRVESGTTMRATRRCTERTCANNPNSRYHRQTNRKLIPDAAQYDVTSSRIHASAHMCHVNAIFVRVGYRTGGSATR